MKSSTATAAPLGRPLPEESLDATYRKIIWRLVPFLFCCYILNYIDRLNIGFAKLGFNEDLGFNDAIFGIGVSAFFVGYLMFELPSTMMLARWGARRSVARIMILWGAFTIATLFIRTPLQFYGVRALLGMAEAGFLPGIILYLTFWFPNKRKAQVTALFMSALPVAGILSGPLAGSIMEYMTQFEGLRDWQWLFLIEGVPAVLLGIAALFYLTDTPRAAKWLTDREKDAVEQTLREQKAPEVLRGWSVIGELLREPRIYVLALLAFSAYCTASTLAFWSPTIIKGSGVTDKLTIGLLASLPSVAGWITMLWNGRHSDRMQERRWHAAIAGLVAAAGLGMLPIFQHNTVMAVVLLTVAGAGHFAFLPMTWAIPAMFLGKARAAAGIGIVASLASLGGVASSMVLGWAKTSLGSFAVGLYLIDAVVVLAIVLMLVFIPARTLNRQSTH